jgi:hypothetical protein
VRGEMPRPLSEAEAKTIWNEKTNNETRATSLIDFDDYRILSFDIKMRRGEGDV